MVKEEWKRAAAKAAAKLVKDGMVVGLGSGTTMMQVVRAIARREPDAIFVPSSLAIKELASELGLKLGSLDDFQELDLVLDGADEVDANFNLIKGRRGAHTREKLLTSVAKRVVIVVDRGKLVKRLGERTPVPVEVLPFAHKLATRKLTELGGRPELRLTQTGALFVTDNGNYILDVKFARIARPVKLEQAINRVPGVVENGLFVDIADAILVGHGKGCAMLRSKNDFLKFVHA